ncbi:MAG: PAS domain-containing protein [Alphaproteobacteria bacterium]|nr:PAS domain-containing protein [Alphaproteobacteria bacterium]
MPSGTEIRFSDNEIIVSKTDPKGRITYVNDVFMRVAGYCESELIGKAHNIIRHPDMPRCAFKLVWDSISTGNEVFAYVINRTKAADYYWVFAHITPRFDESGAVTGYHSSRRCPRRGAIEKIAPVYARLVDIERKAADRKMGLNASTATLTQILKDAKVNYEQFVFGL